MLTFLISKYRHLATKWNLFCQLVRVGGSSIRTNSAGLPPPRRRKGLLCSAFVLFVLHILVLLACSINSILGLLVSLAFVVRGTIGWRLKNKQKNKTDQSNKQQTSKQTKRIPLPHNTPFIPPLAPPSHPTPTLWLSPSILHPWTSPSAPFKINHSTL